MDTMLGYDVYSNVLADIVCEPSLSLPLTVGLYAKWRLGKSILLAKLKDSMNIFSRNWLEGAHLSMSSLIFFYLTLFCVIFTMTISTACATAATLPGLIAAWIVGGCLLVLLISAYCFLYYGSEMRGWSAPTRVATSLSRFIYRVRLLWNVATLYAPVHTENDIASNPVSFLLADYHRPQLVVSKPLLKSSQHYLKLLRPTLVFYPCDSFARCALPILDNMDPCGDTVVFPLFC